MPVPSAALTLPATPTVQQLYDELREEFQLLRNELRQEQQEILARVTALELRTLTGKRNSHSVWRAGSDGSEASPKSKGSRPKSIWKTSTDPLTPQSHMTSDTNGPNGPNGPNENRQAHEAETNELQATDTNLQIDMPADTVNEAAVFDDGLEEVEVHFEDSAWSIPMVLGLVDAGRFDTGYAVLLLLVNCGMQVMFSGILLSDGFMGEDFSEEKENAEIWRTSVAHDYKYMDLAQTSLVIWVFQLVMVQTLNCPPFNRGCCSVSFAFCCGAFVSTRSSAVSPCPWPLPVRFPGRKRRFSKRERSTGSRLVALVCYSSPISRAWRLQRFYSSRGSPGWRGPLRSRSSC